MGGLGIGFALVRRSAARGGGSRPTDLPRVRMRTTQSIKPDTRLRVLRDTILLYWLCGRTGLSVHEGGKPSCEPAKSFSPGARPNLSQA